MYDSPSTIRDDLERPWPVIHAQSMPVGRHLHHDQIGVFLSLFQIESRLTLSESIEHLLLYG